MLVVHEKMVKNVIIKYCNLYKSFKENLDRHNVIVYSCYLTEFLDI